jgi:CO/xanthine dehydrogenase FAD-binding subunit
MTTLRQLETDEALNRYTMNAVRDAVKDIVGIQFRNTATIGGSIFGRYGFSDVLTVFMAMDAYVECHKAGLIPIREFAQMKADRDVLVKIIVKKSPIHMAYQAQRHARTDFPMLAVAVSFLDGKWNAVVGARPAKAVAVVDASGLGLEVTEAEAKAFGEYVAEQLTFGSNMRGSAEYRKMITPVLVKRAMLAAGKEL